MFKQIRQALGSKGTAAQGGEQGEELSAEIHTLHQISLRLHTIQPQHNLAQAIIDILENVMGYEHGAVLVISDDGKQLLPYALSRQGRDEAFLEADKAMITSHQIVVGQGITGWVAAHGVTVRTGDVAQDSRYYGVRNAIRSELCAPLVDNGRVIGVLNVETARPDAYSVADQRLLEIVAAEVARAIQNQRYRATLDEYTATLEQKVTARTAELSAANRQLQAEIDERTRAQQERDRLIEELQVALADVKTLRGLLPICASCKKIRDDGGYWQQIEVYVRDHTHAEFSHSICPSCFEKLYPGLTYRGPSAPRQDI